MQGIGWVSYIRMHWLTDAEERNRALQCAASTLTQLLVQNMPTIVHKLAKRENMNNSVQDILATHKTIQTHHPSSSYHLVGTQNMPGSLSASLLASCM